MPWVPATGVYCWMTANDDNWWRRSPVVFVADGVARLAARREPCADPLARNAD
jgi:hypothetical protein